MKQFRDIRSPARPAAGFTLIEILIVIAIIAILAGLVMVATAQMRKNAQVSRMRAIFAGLTGIAAEYEVMTTMPVEHHSSGVFNWDQPQPRNNVDHGQAGNPAVITGSGPTSAAQDANLYIERFVAAAWQLPTLRNALPSLGEDIFVDEDGDGFMEVRDPWGNNIAYASRVRHPADKFLPEHEDPFFASPGPDGEWGEPGSPDEEPSAAARDNLYSFEIDRRGEQ